MGTYRTPVSARGLGMTSVVLGLLGGALFWWVPMGMVLSLSGLMAGFVGWGIAPRKAPGVGVAIAGILVCAAALALDWVIAGLGLEILKFQALR